MHGEFKLMKFQLLKVEKLRKKNLFGTHLWKHAKLINGGEGNSAECGLSARAGGYKSSKITYGRWCVRIFQDVKVRLFDTPIANHLPFNSRVQLLVGDDFIHCTENKFFHKRFL